MKPTLIPWILAGLAVLQTGTGPVRAQDGAAPVEAVAVDEAPEPLSEEELEILVARIALYPDELVALIASASLYPLQVIEAARFLDKLASDDTLQPKESWDGSIVSLLNYPEIVRMMSDDLDWTQALGDALAYQQKEVLIAIQQLRDKAVAEGIIRSDDKVTVINEGDNVVIQSASPEIIYVPRYEPAVLYDPGYVAVPITYYPDPYPTYYYPTATFFAGAVTGAIFASALDWDDWDVWGGNFDRDIDIDCNNCFNDRDFSGKVNINDVDWNKVDRTKINVDRDTINNFDRTEVRKNLKQNERYSVKNKTANVRNDRNTQIANKSNKISDVRSKEVNAKKDIAAKRPAANKPALNKPSANKPTVSRPSANKPALNKPSANKPSLNKPNEATRPAGKPKPGAKVDKRPKQPSALGRPTSGKKASLQSNRGKKAKPAQVRRPAGRSGGGGGRKR